MMIIITGVAGFVGSNVAQALSRKYNVFGIDDMSFGNVVNIPGGIRYKRMRFQDLMEGGVDDILIHCATSNIVYSMDHPVETFKNNAEDTIRLFKMWRGKIVYTSTSSVYGNADVIPTPEFAEIKSSNAYDMSKYIAEQYLQSRGNYTTLRLSNVYGFNQLPSNPYCGVMGKLIDCAMENKIFEVYGNGRDSRDYTFVEDVVEAVQKAVERGATNKEINIATGREACVDDLIAIVTTLTGWNKVNYSGWSRKIDKIRRRVLDVRLAKKELDWSPKTSLETGIERTIGWFREWPIQTRNIAERF